MTGSHALRRARARRLAGAYTLGELSDSLVAVGLALLVLHKTGSVVWTTAYFVLAKGLPALVAPAITAALDRHALVRLEWLYGGQALLIAAMCALTLPGFVLPVAALAATCALPARSLTRAQIARRLVGTGLLREGNAFVNIAFAAAATVGAAAGGALVAAAGYRAALIAGAVAALAAVPLARGVRGRGTAAGWRHELRNGLEYARSTPGVRSLLWLEGMALLAFTLVIPIEVLYAERSLDVGAAGYGALIAAWGAGIFAGGFAFAALRRRRLLMLAAGATCVIGVAYVGLALVSTIVVACLISFAGGAGNGIQWVAVVTALQESVPDEYQARVVGLLDSAATLAPVIAYTVGGALAQTLSPRAAYAVAGVGTLMCSIAFVRVAQRERGARVERPLVPEAAR
ncbi:MAG TPA: MFS transporter [Thermoleophilaceae bacterium]|nr:MFS transporter [Thermoleophilaceae bacterium]